MSRHMTSPDLAADLRFFYCGRGDTILLEARGGGWGLIDCNLTRDSQAEERIRKLIQKKKIEELEFVCLTHPDLDHYRGMRSLLSSRFQDRKRKQWQLHFKQFWHAGIDVRVLKAVAERMGTKNVANELTALHDFLSPLFDRDAVQKIAVNAGAIVCASFGEFLFVSLWPWQN